jgi:hypothetical protein
MVEGSQQQPEYFEELVVVNLVIKFHDFGKLIPIKFRIKSCRKPSYPIFDDLDALLKSP